MSLFRRAKSSRRQVKNYTPTEGVAVDHALQVAPVEQLKVRKPKRRWGRWVAAFIVLIVLAALAYGVYLATIVVKISSNPTSLAGLTADSSGRTNVLILGQGDPGHDGEGLTDTMMVISYDATSKRVAEISVPRDLRVNIPGYGTGKINSANSLGGSALASQVVSSTLGIPINYVVQTDFTGLKELVDAVGGIDVNVKDRLVDTEYPCDYNQYKVCGLDIEPGQQHMNGTVALEYVRCRKGTCGNDFGRAARQQEVISLVRQKLVRWQLALNPKQLILVTNAVRDSLKTDLGSVQMLEFALDLQRAQKNQPVQFVFSTSPGGYLTSAQGSSDLLPIGGNFSQMQAKAQTIFAPNAAP